ncbi:hypothetical protein DXZ20_15520 [Leptolyngbyaceae cyanobacterium CCMR0081]|uniref:Cyanobacterial TRADD-N associated 2 transmembrane domain-containing protein n=2 Tax=Adonisia TaxID=2950183 RepID=A0A6M0RN31_9CYAN|nr:hypothetical protein [Adonisia turfae CCMR0081]
MLPSTSQKNLNIGLQPDKQLLLTTRRNERVQKRRALQKVVYISLLTSISLPILIVAILLRGQYLSNPLYILSGVSYGIVPIAAVIYFSLRLRQVEEEIQDLDFELDLLKYKATLQEIRAEKLLQINDVQLRRYYNLNLKQNTWVFCLGIFCILIGVSIIGVTLFLLLRVADDTETKIVAGAVGAIGSLLVNYVAAIYLKIHADATSNLSDFHSRLVETQQILLANLLASRIEHKTDRWKTISQLAINVGTKKSN